MASSPKCTVCGELLVDQDLSVCPICQAHPTITVAPKTTPLDDATIAPDSSGTNGAIGSPIGSLPNSNFGEYELLEEIARGGMGVVFKARHRRLDRITAIKMILSGKFSSPEELQRFNIEASAAARLDHPGIVPVYEIGESNGQAYFAMKYIEGGSLASEISSLRERPRDGIAMLVKVARAVHHAHQRGILHRDLKPANILIDEDYQPLLTDLGLAKSITGGSDLTHTGAVIGTPSYMPPEQASGGTVTTASDTYSLGAILYEMLTGQPPFKGSSSIDTVMKVLAESPEPPSKLVPTIDRDLELIALKCLEREPEARYDSASALADDLEAWLEGESISIKPPSVSALAGRWFRKNRKLIYVAFGLLAGFVFSLPFLLMFSSGNPDEVYSYFPDADRKLIFKLGILPKWLGAISFAVLVLGVWPSIGFLSAAISGANSKRKALWNGVITAFLFSLVVAPLLGWMVITQSVGNSSGFHYRLLANAVWPSEKVDLLETNQGLENIFGGIDHIPESDRGRIVAERMMIEQMGSVSTGFLILGVVLTVFLIPMVYGTVVAWILIARKTNIFVALIRYMFAWWAIIATILTITSLIFPSIVRVSGKNTIDFPLITGGVLLAFLLIIFLTLRRWKKQPSNAIGKTTARVV